MNDNVKKKSSVGVLWDDNFARSFIKNIEHPLFYVTYSLLLTMMFHVVSGNNPTEFLELFFAPYFKVLFQNHMLFQSTQPPSLGKGVTQVCHEVARE